MTIPDGFAQCNVKFTGTGVPTGAECTFGVSVEAVADTPVELATFVAAQWVATIGHSQTNQVGVGSVLVKYGPDATGPFAEVVGAGAAGTASASAPPNVAILAKKNTGFGGRKGSGRWFLPGFSETAIDQGGNLDPGLASELQANIDDFLEDLTGHLTPMVLLHQDDVTPPYAVTGITVQNKVATQRRRLRR